MTYTPQKQIRLIFDIETVCNPENLALAPEPKAPANLKDPAKIAAAIEDKKRELIESAALDPDYGKILSLGYATSLNGPVTVFLSNEVYAMTAANADGPITVNETFRTEREIIEDFWSLFAACNGCAVGYNILGFDLPYLMRRSMALGVQVPFIPNLAKFKTEPITDLMAILYNWGSDRYKGLKQVAKLYGIQNDCPDVDGSQVKDLTPEQLCAYQASDVDLVRRLYQRMNGVYFSQ